MVLICAIPTEDSDLCRKEQHNYHRHSNSSASCCNCFRGGYFYLHSFKSEEVGEEV